MRDYIVIPEGTPVIRVPASSPQYAESKARRGKAPVIAHEGAIVIPITRTKRIGEPHAMIPGQLTLVAEPEHEPRPSRGQNIIA